MKRQEIDRLNTLYRKKFNTGPINDKIWFKSLKDLSFEKINRLLETSETEDDFEVNMIVLVDYEISPKSISCSYDRNDKIVSVLPNIFWVIAIALSIWVEYYICMLIYIIFFIVYSIISFRVFTEKVDVNGVMVDYRKFFFYKLSFHIENIVDIKVSVDNTYYPKDTHFVITLSDDTKLKIHSGINNYEDLKIYFMTICRKNNSNK